MAKNNLGITGHLLVKNEDQWIWYVINSVLPYLDSLHIIDTGSTDRTVEIIKSISSPKIHFFQKKVSSRAELTALRQFQLTKTKTPWVWIIDGDEIYPSAVVKECLAAICKKRYEGIVVRRYDLLGDIYHRQFESVGTYKLFNQQGHLLIRLFNQSKLPGVHYVGDYPLEDLVDGDGVSLQTHDPRKWFITSNSLYHAMYLKRSSLGSNLTSMFNRGKYKIETGMSIKGSMPPSVFFLPHPPKVPNVLLPRPLIYRLLAALITPLKNLKRQFFNYFTVPIKKLK